MKEEEILQNLINGIIKDFRETFNADLNNWDKPVIEEWLKRITKENISEICKLEYKNCEQEMKQDLTSVINFLEGDVEKEKIVNYIKEYLLKN